MRRKNHVFCLLRYMIHGSHACHRHINHRETAPVMTMTNRHSYWAQVIRRPKVEYQSLKDSFELTIRSSDDVGSIKKLVEAQHGLPADSHTLVWKGKRLSASKSLASYGVGGGSVLELVPIEPLQPGRMPSGSPLLSSPQHELVIPPTTLPEPGLCCIQSLMYNHTAFLMYTPVHLFCLY